MTPLHHRISGKGPPLLLLGGLGADHTTFNWVKPFLSPYFTLILPDNRSSGKSFHPNTEYRLEDMAEDTLALLNHLNIESCYLLGQSMGSVIAQLIALKWPKRIQKLILSNTLLKAEPVPLSVFTAFGHLLEIRDAEQRASETLLPWLFSSQFLSDGARKEEMLSIWNSNPNKQSASAFWKQYNALKKVDTAPLLHKIQTPTLVLAGEEDLLTPLRDAEQVASKIPHALLHILGGVGHIPHIEIPERFAEAVKAFLR